MTDETKPASEAEVVKAATHAAASLGDALRGNALMIRAGAFDADQDSGWFARALEHKAAQADTLAARVRVLEEATRAFVAWLDAEDSYPNYGSLTRDTHPEGERIWREWWDRNLRLCKESQELGRAALSTEARHD